MAIGQFLRTTEDVVFDVATILDGAAATTTITAGGDGYALATGVATVTGGTGDDTLTVDITSITDGEVATVTISAEGSGYTAGEEETTGAGTGATVDITTKDGAAVTTTITAGGDGYTTASGVATVTGGTGDDTLTVDIVAADTVTSLTQTAAGTGYDASATGAATIYAGAGIGLTVDYTATVGAVDATPTINNAGEGYTNNDVVTIVGGDMNSTLTLTVVSGVIQSITINDSGEGNTAADIITISTGSANATFTVDSIADGAIDTAVINAGGADYTVADILTVATGVGGTVTVATVTDGIVTGISINNSGADNTVADVVTIAGGSANATFTVDTIVDGKILTVTVTDGGTGYEVGDILNAADITNDGGGDDAAQFVVATETVAGSGIVATLTTTIGGTGYDVADTLTCAGSNEAGVSDSTLYINHNQYEQGGVVGEYEKPRNATSPQSDWQGTMSGTWNPLDVPSLSPDDNNPAITAVLKSDLPQLAVMKKTLADGVVVYAEPTTVDRNGNVVGGTVRAEDFTDQARCEALGFIWDTATTGDADAASYGFCREMTVAEAVIAWSGVATDYPDCPAGTIFDTDSCVALDDTAATGADLINAAVLAGEISSEKGMRDCEVSGNFWDITTGTCIAGDTPANFDLSTFTFGTPTAGTTGSSNGTPRDYLANACRQLGYVWNYTDNTCNATVDPATLITQATCSAAGYIWIAGSCYNPNDFGDGQSRNATAQQNPKVAPK